jgi:hypothetical protein
MSSSRSIMTQLPGYLANISSKWKLDLVSLYAGNNPLFNLATGIKGTTSDSLIYGDEGFLKIEAADNSYAAPEIRHQSPFPVLCGLLLVVKRYGGCQTSSQPFFGSGSGSYDPGKFTFSTTDTLTVTAAGNSAPTNTWTVESLPLNLIRAIYVGWLVDDVAVDPIVVINGKQVSTTKSGTATGNFAWRGETPSTLYINNDAGGYGRHVMFGLGAMLRNPSLRQGIELTQNPWQLFRASRRASYAFTAAGTANVSPSITGAVGTTAVGTLVPSLTGVITGVSATGSVGTLTATTAELVSLTGVVATSAVQALTPTVSKALTGVAGTGSVGTLTISNATTITLSGVSATGTVGALSETISGSTTLAGVVGTGQAGTVSISTGSNASSALTGVSGTGAVGSLSLTVAANDSGVSATGQVQPLGILRLVALNGVTCTGQVGNLTVVSGVTASAIGVSATGQIQAIGGNIYAGMPSIFAVGYAGSVHGVGAFSAIRNYVEFSPRFSKIINNGVQFSRTISKGVKF